MTAVTSDQPIWPNLGLMVEFIREALQVGTGGSPTVSYYQDKGYQGYAEADVQLTDEDVLGSTPTPIENLSRIREMLGANITDIARIVGVSRQAIYDWQSGAQIAEKNAAKLAELASAADVFAAEGITASHHLLIRPISGRSFVDRVHGGESPRDVAEALLKIVRRELEQRRALDRLLKGRKTLRIEEVGLPYLTEEE